MINDNFDVAISYSQDNKEHVARVISFANFLRQNGYNCVMDQLIKQHFSSADFNEMMIGMISHAPKVIVILTPTYKHKAENFIDGVGKEYRIINDEICHNHSKYILATFLSLDSYSYTELLPNGLEGREILDLNEDAQNNYNLLFSKLSDTPLYDFVPVSPNKRKISTEKIPDFAPTQSGRSKDEIFKSIQLKLIENKQLLFQYGPDSLIAINNPLSDAINTWNEMKKTKLIPNNSAIINLLDNNIDLLLPNELEIFQKFKIHAQAFERNQGIRQDSQSVPCFPKEFEEMIFKKEN